MADAPAPYRLLFCDDDPDMIKLMVGHFSALGHECHSASNGSACLELHKVVKPEVTVLDVNMPGMTGMEVLETLRRRGAAVIMLTGEQELALALQALKQGAENYLVKPTDMGHLETMVDRAVEKVRAIAT